MNVALRWNNVVDTLFNIKRVEQEAHSIIYHAEIDERHPVLLGHFPQNPVVPGVGTMNLVKLCLSDALGYRVRYHYVKECKFLAAIIPSQHAKLEISIAIKQNEEPINIIAEVRSGDAKMMKLKATVCKQLDE